MGSISRRLALLAGWSVECAIDFDDIFVSIFNFETRCSISATSLVGYDDTDLLSLFLLRIGFVGIPDTIVCLGALV